MNILYVSSDGIKRLECQLKNAQQSAVSICHGESLAAAIAILDQVPIDVILVRLPFGDRTSESVILELRARDSSTPIVLWSREGRTTDAIRFFQLGIYQYVTDDMTGDELVQNLLDAVAERRSRERQNSIDVPADEPWRSFLVGQSFPMKMIHQLIRLVSPRRCTVLITGETGTGKEMIARALHMASPRANFPMVAVNCSALPGELLEAELFGHVKGAFTGAFGNRVGRFEQAHRGTIFLDEVTEMPLSLQAKLLRVLQELEFQRLGSSETVRVDVRVIAASNANLLDRVRSGQFREDLYYRLNVAPIQAPPLRKRTEDIPLLVNHFILKICREEGIEPKALAAGVVERMGTLPWPGNVRQLENVVEMAIAMSADRPTLTLSDFPGLFLGSSMAANSHVLVPEDGLNYNEVVDDFERSILEQALRNAQGNKKLAASRLQLKRSTFAAKLRTLSIALQKEGDCDDEDDSDLASPKKIEERGFETVYHSPGVH